MKKKIIKRLLDILFSSLALLFLLPVICGIAILLRISSQGPVFYRQIRVGKNRKEFILIKFRTMRVGADRKGPLVTQNGDARITTAGRLLRRSKLDELPELWNVLTGDMSLVGPRPEVPKYVKHYHPEWERVFAVQPGITDLATLQFRDEESVLLETNDIERTYIDIVLPIKINLALEYVDSHSIWLDLKILILTVWGITLGKFFMKPDDKLAVFALDKIKTMNKQIISGNSE